MQDISSKKFNRLTVIEFCGMGTQNKPMPMWKCKCDCGKECVVSYYSIMNGHTKSCGCIQREFISSLNTVHGGINDRLYRVWRNIITRCTYKKCAGYDIYGGRGIKVCQEWLHGYGAFKRWAYSHGYDENAEKFKCTIDRIDTNGDYCPENCRWVSQLVNDNDRRTSVYINVNGEKITMSNAARKYGVSYKSLSSGIKRGIDADTVVSTLVAKKKEEKRKRR